MSTPLNPIGSGTNGQVSVSWTPPVGGSVSGYVVMSNYGTPGTPGSTGSTGSTGPTGPAGPLVDLSDNKAVFQKNYNLTSAQTITVDTADKITIGSYVDYNNTYYNLYTNNLRTSFEDSSLNSINATWTQSGSGVFIFNSSIGAHTSYISDSLAKCTNDSPINCKISVVVAPGLTLYNNTTVSQAAVHIYDNSSDKYYQLFYETTSDNSSPRIYTTTLYIKDYDGANLITPESSPNNNGPRLIEIYRNADTIRFDVSGATKYSGPIHNVGTDVALFGRSCYTEGNDTIYFRNFSITALLSVPNSLALMSGGDILPNIPYTYNIGSSNFPFNEIYINNMNILGLENQTVSNFLTYNTVTGRIGYDVVGSNGQVIYNSNGLLDGTDNVTISNDVLYVGPRATNNTSFTDLYYSPLNSSASLNSPITLNNSIISSIQYFEENTDKRVYTDTSGMYILNLADNVSFGLDYSGNFDNEIQISQKNGNSQSRTNSISYKIYVNYTGNGVNGRNYYEFKYSYYSDSATPIVTRQVIDPTNSIIYTSYIVNNFIGENYSVQIQRLRIGFSIIENGVKLFSTTESQLTNKFTIHVFRPGNYGAPIYFSNLYLKHIDGFPLTCSFVTGGDIVPNKDNVMYLGNNDFSFKNIYANNIIPNNIDTQLTVYGDIASQGDIEARSFITSSDSRIKSNITNLNTSDSLNIINNLTPKTFTLHTPHGNITNVPGFISQEVEEIYPLAVSNGNKYIGNIKKMYPCILQHTIENNIMNSYVYTVDISDISSISYPAELSIRIGDKVQYITIHYSTFSFTSVEQLEQVYVFGTLTTDFKLLSYDYIYTHNVSATKELYNLITALESRIAALENP